MASCFNCSRIPCKDFTLDYCPIQESEDMEHDFSIVEQPKPKCSKCGSTKIEIDFRFGIGCCFDCGDTWTFDDLG